MKGQTCVGSASRTVSCHELRRPACDSAILWHALASVSIPAPSSLVIRHPQLGPSVPEVGSPGHRIVVQTWSSMPAVTSGMAVPPCRACDRLGGVSFLLEYAKCTVINPCVSLPLYLLDKIYLSLTPQCVKSLSLSNSQVCEAH